MAEVDSIRLTQLAKRAGCAAKQPPGYLLPLLDKLPAVTDPNVLVGSATADDAAIYRLNDDLALVLTATVHVLGAPLGVRKRSESA